MIHSKLDSAGRKAATHQIALFLLLFIGFLAYGPAANAAPAVKPVPTCRVLVVAFVGGLGTATFPPSVATPVINEVRDIEPSDICVKRVSSYFPWTAWPWVHKQIQLSRKTPSAGAHTDPRIVLFGYSLGVPTALRFARKLDKENVPVELLVTVDSKGFTKGIIPANVKTAANYYERELFPAFYPLYYGKKDLQPEDPQSTNFLGNIRVVHAGHFSIVGDKGIRTLLATTVRDALVPAETASTSSGE